MTDQDWEVDGAAGAAADGGGTAGQAAPEAPKPTPPTNVVPFPGSWFGSIEELVPIGTDSHAAAATADANAFWDGEALPLQELAPPDVGAGGPPVAAHAVPADDTTAFAEGPGADTGYVAVMSSRRFRASVALLCTVLVTAAACGALLLVHSFTVGRRSLSGHGARTARDPATKVLTETVTTPVTVTTPAPINTREGGASRSTGVRGPRRTATPQSHRSGAGGNPVQSSPSRGPTVVQRSALATSPDVAPPSTGAASPTAGGLASGTTVGRRPQTGCAQSPDSGCLP